MADRQFTEDTLVIATHNAGKMREIGALFAGFDIDILSAADLGLAELYDQVSTFEAAFGRWTLRGDARNGISFRFLTEVRDTAEVGPTTVALDLGPPFDGYIFRSIGIRRGLDHQVF